MFRALLCPASGALDDSVGLPHRPSVSRVAAGWRLSAGRTDECPTVYVVNQRYRRELLKMGIIVPETC